MSLAETHLVLFTCDIMTIWLERPNDIDLLNISKLKYESLSQKPDHQKSGEYAIYRLGCLTILDDLYLTEVKPILQPVYMILSIVIAIVEIASVALAAAYINVLKKKAISGTWFDLNSLYYILNYLINFKYVKYMFIT